MITLKNDEQLFVQDTFLELYLKKEQPDCSIFSKEGTKFNIHKELLYQTKLMKNILSDNYSVYFRNIEIFCPCSDNELKSILNFLYSGTMSFKNEFGVVKLLENLTKLFGFPGKLFSIESVSMSNENIEIKGEEEVFEEHFNEITYKINSSNQALGNTDFSPFESTEDKDPLTSNAVFIPFNPNNYKIEGESKNSRLTQKLALTQKLLFSEEIHMFCPMDP